MTPDKYPPTGPRRRTGDEDHDQDELSSFWHEQPEPKPKRKRSVARGIVIGAALGLATWAVLFMAVLFVPPVFYAISDASVPTACAEHRAEVVACAEGMGR